MRHINPRYLLTYLLTGNQCAAATHARTDRLQSFNTSNPHTHVHTYTNIYTQASSSSSAAAAVALTRVDLLLANKSQLNCDDDESSKCLRLRPRFGVTPLFCDANSIVGCTAKHTQQRDLVKPHHTMLSSSSSSSQAEYMLCTVSSISSYLLHHTHIHVC